MRNSMKKQKKGKTQKILRIIAKSCFVSNKTKLQQPKLEEEERNQRCLETVYRWKLSLGSKEIALPYDDEQQVAAERPVILILQGFKIFNFLTGSVSKGFERIKLRTFYHSSSPLSQSLLICSNLFEVPIFFQPFCVEV